MPISSPLPPFFGPKFPLPNSPPSNPGGSPAGTANISCSYTTETTVCSEISPPCGGTWSINEVGAGGGTNGLNYGGGTIPDDGNFTVDSTAYCAGYPAFMVVSATCSDGSTVILDSFVSSGTDDEGNCTASDYSRSFVGVCCPAPEEKCVKTEVPGSWAEEIQLTLQCAIPLSVIRAFNLNPDVHAARMASQFLQAFKDPAILSVLTAQMARDVGMSINAPASQIAAAWFKKVSILANKTTGRCSAIFPGHTGGNTAYNKTIADIIKRVLGDAGKPPTGGGGGGIGVGLPTMIMMPTMEMLQEMLQEKINQFQQNPLFRNVKCAMNTTPGGGGPTVGTPVGPGAPSISTSIASVSALPTITNSMSSIGQNNMLLHINNGFPIKRGRVTFRVPKNL